MKLLIALVCFVPAALCVEQGVEAGSHANPIRKVVTMLQDMSAKVTAQGVKEEELYEKFMCYCKNNVGTLEGSIAAAKAKIESLGTSSEGSAAKLEQTKADLKAHTASRNEAKMAMSKATTIRNKQASEFAEYKETADTNIAAMKKAVSAISTGMSGAFLQTAEANAVKSFTMEKADVDDQTRKEVLSFLSGTQTQGYAPASGEIVGILQQMLDTMAKDLADATEDEKAAIASYESLMAAKEKEVETLQAQIEKELKDIGELEVANAEMANDLEETQQALAADQKFLAELNKGCATKTAEWEEVQKERKAELLALADTIKILNDDDALELFKKTLPGASASFMQLQVDTSSMRARALAALREAHVRSPRSQHIPARPQFDLIELALNGKQMGFEKVIKMIDSMVVSLKKEQSDDDAKKSYCEQSFDETEDKKKVLQGQISDSGLAIEDMTGALATLKEEIAALEAGIKKLDKAVADATEQRKAESADFEELMTSDTAAKEILLFAKNRLNKFYNPKLYKAPPKQELSSEDRIVSNFAFAQISMHTHDEDEDDKVAPPPPPETFGPYSKKTEESGGVIAMIDLLVGDLDKEMQTAKVDEKNAQEEYETLMADSGEKRKADTAALTEKNTAKAETETQLQTEKQNKKDKGIELMGTDKELYALHAECDWLMKFFDVRKEARTGEIDALGKAKAVLSGADYSLLQTQRSLRR